VDVAEMIAGYVRRALTGEFGDDEQQAAERFVAAVNDLNGWCDGSR
jgi:hypothetical protein